MAEIRSLRESTFGQQQIEIDIAPPMRFCAYNQTGKRFISNNVEVADASAVSLQDCLSNLNPRSESAVWVAPMRTLSASDFRFPADLLYLGEGFVVLEIVQAFPIGRPSQQETNAASILALPAHGVLSAGIKAGDRLLVCAPEEMQRYLLDSPLPEPVRAQSITPEPEQEVLQDIGQLWKWEEQLNTNVGPTQEVPSPDQLKPAAVAGGSEAQMQEMAPAPWNPTLPEEKSAGRRLWRKLFSKKPTDLRHASRMALPGLVAYFFTGSAPVAHRVRNISMSGLHVLTSERWYKGTVVRITLTNENEPTTDKSITLHAKVIRWTDHGVALKFILHDKDERLRGVNSTLDHLSGGASIREIEEFIERYKSHS